MLIKKRAAKENGTQLFITKLSTRVFNLIIIFTNKKVHYTKKERK